MYLAESLILNILMSQGKLRGKEMSASNQILNTTKATCVLYKHSMEFEGHSIGSESIVIMEEESERSMM